MAFTELYVDPVGGSNLNAGAPVGGSYPVTSTNGAYLQAGGAGGTDLFTAAAGTPFSGCAVGDFVSIYLDGAAAPTGFVAAITAVNGGGASLDISLTKISGTRFTTTASGVTATVGGAWLGPNGASGFPFAFVTGVLTDAAGNMVRVNFLNSATYNITAAINDTLAGPRRFEGYTATLGDGGKATIDGGTGGTGYALLTVNNTSSNTELINFIFQNNGSTSSPAGVSFINPNHYVKGCVFRNVRGSGLSLGSGSTIVEECEAYGCNQSNTANKGGFETTESCIFLRCVAHDNVGSANAGFAILGGGTVVMVGCVAESNGRDGAKITIGNTCVTMHGCDFYNNAAAGIDHNAASATSCLIIENCNFLKNGTYGFNGSGAAGRHGAIINCGFGAGTQQNSLGPTNSLKGIEVIGSVTYPNDVTPWVDPANGDFRINLAEAKGTGRGAYTQTAVSYAGTVGYPDRGAAQHADAGGTVSMDRSFGVLVRA